MPSLAAATAGSRIVAGSPDPATGPDRRRGKVFARRVRTIAFHIGLIKGPVLTTKEAAVKAFRTNR